MSPTEVLSRGPVCRTYAEVTELRSRDPQAIGRALAARRRRPSFVPPDGRLMLVAADHPARGALAAQGRPTAMASRTDLLDRLRTALARPGVDGLLATADIAEDLLLTGALEDKVVVASMNRGGLAGASFELDDRMTGYDVAGVVAARFEAAKMLNRIDLDDPGTVRMLETTGRTISELARAGIVMMLEPFLSHRVDGRVVNDLTPDGVIKSVSVAQGLGATSAYTWLKLPVVAEMERVMDATTLPTLLLGGDPSGHPEETYASWRDALVLPAVRGLVIGRTLLYPPDDDVETAVDTAVSLVH
jgi:DhnA family fructose-bisphosphate aldolase class Ia